MRLLAALSVPYRLSFIHLLTSQTSLPVKLLLNALTLGWFSRAVKKRRSPRALQLTVAALGMATQGGTPTTKKTQIFQFI